MFCTADGELSESILYDMYLDTKLVLTMDSRRTILHVRATRFIVHAFTRG